VQDSAIKPNTLKTRVKLDLKLLMTELKMATGNIPKINLRNSLTECGQSVRKENAGKFQNYAIKDCKASIAAGKIK
jgi:hypothetical protein